jgi:hypothetical protein
MSIEPTSNFVLFKTSSSLNIKLGSDVKYVTTMSEIQWKYYVFQFNAKLVLFINYSTNLNL